MPHHPHLPYDNNLAISSGLELTQGRARSPVEVRSLVNITCGNLPSTTDSRTHIRKMPRMPTPSPSAARRRELPEGQELDLHRHLRPVLVATGQGQPESFSHGYAQTIAER